MDTVTPFHGGEREAQRLAGFQIDRAPIRDHLSEQHRAFFAAQPFLLVAGMAADGALAATVLTGAPGFVSSPDPSTLRVEAVPDARDPLSALVTPGTPIGVLGIDFASRRRNRANGCITTVTDAGFTFAVEQSFGNCMRYIRVRHMMAATQRAAALRGNVGWLTGLDKEARAFIQSADTFFVASSSGPAGISHGGVDISHRGGLSGFVSIDGNRLHIPDFAGNRYFNTLGNFLCHPEAALLFLDFATGDLLHVAGAIVVNWIPGAGAERSWDVEIRSAWRWRGAVPYRWQLHEEAQRTRTSVS